MNASKDKKMPKLNQAEKLEPKKSKDNATDSRLLNKPKVDPIKDKKGCC